MADFDVLVAGGGMAGMVAAGAATAEGARVLVVEKADRPGGSAALSAGICWTAPSLDAYRRRIPRGDAGLGRILVEDFPAAVDFVRAAGVEVAPESHGHMGYGSGHQIDVHGLLARLHRAVEHAGGSVAVRSTVRALTVEDGRVTGAQVGRADAAGGAEPVTASATVLATGGFQGDAGLVGTFIGPGADELLVRSNPGSVGDGLRLGRAAGAALSQGLGAFYGHIVPAPLDRFTADDFVPLTQYHSPHCLLIDALGHRFTDESQGDEITVQDLARRPGGRGILLCDERVRREHVVTAPYPYGAVVDRFAVAVAAGARYATAGDVDALATAVAGWGVPPANLQVTLEAYGRAARGEAVPLDAPIPARPEPLREPPFHALEVQAAITFTHGGLRVDADGRVLDADGLGVPGLYAAGADAGGVHDVGYAGGLATALVFGRRAGRHAAAAARTTSITGGARP